ncbi:hypothetical protein SAMN05661080_02126 [Modestobacter sp. DSM 44400]|uniref:hypothetical protein n=1 Tax=Modestobacter sp. DSM 44400 TaxID=1550230 RepID=UPI0008995892|nr:hypothetical protein [Modestobacter sp. DSM 44400]SDY04731.1 hypothetical protein SAMN05661080_02126 [Modestobacter sp. DSM 44400]
MSDITDPGMTTGAAATTDPGNPVPAPGRWRWVPALVGALVVSLAVAPVGPLPFYVTPLILGVTYLAAAVVGGRSATLWAPGLIITAWGGAVVLVFSHTLNADFAAVAVTALGIGATAAALLGRVGFRMDAIAVALSVLFAGLTELIASLGVAILGRGWFYGALLGVWVLSDLARISPLRRTGSGSARV